MVDIGELKQYILDENQIETVLEGLGCGDIKHKNGYFQCSNPDGGDNKTAICVYENTGLTTVDYTRDICNGRNSADLITLVQYFLGCSFPEAVKNICLWVGIDYYTEIDRELPESLYVLKDLLLLQGDSANDVEREEPVVPINENILSYYRSWDNKLFEQDGIDEDTQIEFEIGYDDESNRITIPIRDELGSLVGVKGRYYGDSEMKYMYLEPCPRFKILYGLNKTYNHIMESKIVYVFEAEKAVMQCWANGVKNTVATGGKKLSQVQIEMLTRLCVPICFCFDKDVQIEELRALADRFIEDVPIYALFDNENILNEKQSPSDDMNKFFILNNNKIRLQ